MSKTILVLAANGNVGKPLVKALLAKGESVRAASRSGAAVEGAEGVVFDYADPSTHDEAFAGIDRAYVVLPGGYVESKALLTPAIEALAARKVKIVLQSVLGVDADDAIPYRRVELALERSGTRYVILRPNWFSDNFHNFWKAGIDHGQIALPAAQGKTSFIDVRDIAASAAAALTSDRFDNQAFNLTGPQALSYAQAAGILAEALHKPVAYQAIDDGTFIDMLTRSGAPEDFAQFLAAIFQPVREGGTAVVTDAVETLSGKKPRTLRAYVADHAADFAA